MKYRKKPVVVEVVRWGGYNFDQVRDFCRAPGAVESRAYMKTVADFTSVLYITTLEGEMYASEGDFIIRGVNGEVYPCKPDIFEKTYEKVED